MRHTLCLRQFCRSFLLFCRLVPYRPALCEWVGGYQNFFLGSATALKAHTLCVRRKQLLARRHLLPMGLGLACTLPPGTGWLSCTFSEQRTCDCYFSQPGHFLFLPFVVRPSGSRCQCRYRTRRSACVCSRGAPLHHTSSCCDVGLDSTSPHSLQESPPRRSPPSPTARGTHFVCVSFAVLFVCFLV